MPTYGDGSVYDGTPTYTPTSTDTYTASSWGAGRNALNGAAAAGANLAGHAVGAAITGGACTSNQVLGTINNFLNFGGGAGAAALVAGASLVDPLAGLGVGLAVSTYEGAYGTNCTPSTDPSPPATAADVASAPAVDLSAVLAGQAVIEADIGAVSGQVSAVQDELDVVESMVGALEVNLLYPVLGAPWFVLQWTDSALPADSFWLSGFQNGPVAADLAAWDGTSTLAWLTAQVADVRDWAVVSGAEDSPYATYAAQSTIDLGVNVYFLPQVAWAYMYQRDFEKHYLYTPSSGLPKRSVLGDWMVYAGLIPINYGGS